MASGSFRFDRFLLDCRNRQLRCDDTPVELNARYLDALALLVREQGNLVSKDQFLDEVWRGIPVTDEALTQCIRSLRRQLGDSAASPRFIATVPKHGYRFLAPVTRIEDEPPPSSRPTRDWRDALPAGAAGTGGAGIAGLVGGLFYGFAGVSQPPQPGVGAVSALLVVMCVTVLMALIGGAGVSFGIAAANQATGGPTRWSILGGAAGGMVVGAVVKLLGLDAFELLLGASPGDITGASEGALLGGAVGLGAWLGSRGSLRRGIGMAALVGAGAGILIPLAGGRLMAGSLDLLASHVPGSRLRMAPIARLFGERDFGLVSQIATGCLEGALFCGCIVGAMILARQCTAKRG